MIKCAKSWENMLFRFNNIMFILHIDNMYICPICIDIYVLFCTATTSSSVFCNFAIILYKLNSQCGNAIFFTGIDIVFTLCSVTYL